MLEIPRVKLQLTKSGFRSTGVKIYNDLLIEHRQVESFSIFKKVVTNYFST